MYTNKQIHTNKQMGTDIQIHSNAHQWRTLGVLGMWGAYVWGTTLAGLAIHPYKSVRRMVLDKPILLPVILSPVMGLVALFVVGRAGSSIVELTGWWREGVALLLGGTLIGLLLWQGLLLFLVFRFARARE